MAEKMDEFLRGIGIEEPGRYEEGKYVVDLPDSDAWSKAHTLIAKSGKADLDGDSVLVSMKASDETFLSDDYDIRLVANFEDDVYKIIMEEAEDL